ncbi:MAG: GNAT family N-acetyltransferase [Lysobacterales bacterium]|jgi:RimJ/RimL family protein N-acetyltransferase
MMNNFYQSNSLRLIKSRRLNLIAATPELIETDIAGRELLSEALDVSIPESWPPDLYGPRAMQFALTQLGDTSEQGWSFWYLLTSNEPAELTGICGFKGRPDESGSVEIGYSILSCYQRLGYATEAVASLVGWAFSHHNVNEVCAETLPHLIQSIRVLEKNGFEYTGAGSETGVIRYAIKRSKLN